jgi:hypothetical protein
MSNHISYRLGQLAHSRGKIKPYILTFKVEPGSSFDSLKVHIIPSSFLYLYLNFSYLGLK